MQSIVGRISPSVDSLLEAGVENDYARLLTRAIRSGVCVSADNLSHGSAIIEQLVQDKTLLIVGAEYSLETGIVDFFYNTPLP